MKVKLEDVCDRDSSNLKQSDITNDDGEYPIYGASGYIGKGNFYHQEMPYVAVVKDGAGIGRAMLLPGKSSVIGTMQYLLPKDNIRADYLYYVVKYMHLEKYFSGATIPHIYFRDYKNEVFNLASLDEQEQIIRILSGVSYVIELRKKQLEQLDTLIKARFVEMFGDPKQNPYGWCVESMAELSIVSSSKRIYQNEQSTKGIPFLRISDLNNLIDYGNIECALYIPESKYNELLAQGQVPVAGDMLITSRGTLGKCYIVKNEDKFYFQDGMISWLSNFKSTIRPVYLSYLFMTSSIREQIDSMQAGSTVAYLSISMIKKLKIMVPRIELQDQFADFVAQIHKIKLELQESLNEVQLLFDSLMQKYFG